MLFQPLAQVGGLSVPFWGGEQAGLPGTAYAKVLRDALSGAYPVASYWRQTFILSDNRIPAMGSDTTIYTFALPQGGGLVTVSAELLFRRMFQAEMLSRGWNSPDILLETAQLSVITPPWWTVFLPVMSK